MTSGHVVEIVLDRPPVNAMRDQDYAALVTALEGAEAAGAHCILLGARGRLFCAGGDLGERPALEGAAGTAAPLAMLAALRSCRVPIVTRVQGVAAGVGVAIALFGDVVVAADDVAFVLPEIDTGAIGGVRMLADLMPRGLARIMALTGERVPVATLVALGIVETVPAERLDARARAVAERIAARGAAGRLAQWRPDRVASL